MGFTPEQVEAMQNRVQEKRQLRPIDIGVKTRARGKTEPRPRVMNKAERKYNAHLAGEKAAGRIIDHKFEACKLRLADNTTITMDFLVIDCDGFVEFHDIKAKWSGQAGPHLEDDFSAKVKVAAELFPYFRFLVVWDESGVWKQREY